MKICRFNSLHHVPPEIGIDVHEDACPSREICDILKDMSLIQPPAPVKHDKSLFTEESWDDIEEVGEGGAGYDPTAKMEKMGHARQVNYLSKGERRYWREQERMRLQSLAEEQNQIKREASAVNRRPEKASEDDDTVPAPSSYDQFIDGHLS